MNNENVVDLEKQRADIATRFQPGQPRRAGSGRRPGQTTRSTRILKDAMLMAAEINGSDGKGKDGLQGYLTMCAHKYPRQYMLLLARLIPLDVKGLGQGNNYVGNVNIVAVPHDRYLTAEQVRKLTPQTIDQACEGDDDDEPDDAA